MAGATNRNAIWKRKFQSKKKSVVTHFIYTEHHNNREVFHPIKILGQSDHSSLTMQIFGHCNWIYIFLPYSFKLHKLRLLVTHPVSESNIFQFSTRTMLMFLWLFLGVQHCIIGGAKNYCEQIHVKVIEYWRQIGKPILWITYLCFMSGGQSIFVKSLGYIAIKWKIPASST